MSHLNGTIIAGINCIDYAWKCLFIDALWVKEEYRRSGLGSKLLADIERTARKHGICLIHLETFDFQALDFYLKHGYEVFGVLDNCPKDHKRYCLKKTIQA
ncbi:GNAT family N-acetyltransferase [Paenibacillus rhizovicinus]|nr:GNAT family N-acetyltransferase [Paenibacillus rhizovicinus]